jgi:hypothetical protein
MPKGDRPLWDRHVERRCDCWPSKSWTLRELVHAKEFFLKLENSIEAVVIYFFGKTMLSVRDFDCGLKS